MGKRDWAGSVLVSCLIAAAAFLHDHTVLLALLLIGAAISAVVIAFDVRGTRERPTSELPRATDTESFHPASVYAEERLRAEARVSGEEEARRRAANTDDLGFLKTSGREHVAGQIRKRAEAQLAAAIRGGNVLRVRGYSEGPLGFQWRDEVETLVKHSAGELEASRFTNSGNIGHWLECLDDLAQQVGGGGKTLKPSKSWDAYVETKATFRQALDARLSEGESIRTELFARTLDAEQADAKVTGWLRSVDEAFSPLPRLAERLRGAYPPGMFATYEGISEDESKNVWRLDRRLEEIQPLLTAVAPYVEALKGD